MFQPTRPRGARHDVHVRLQHHVHVSTHAPTRSATTEGYGVPFGWAVSTHAPTRSATSRRRAWPPMLSMFQPTRPRGARPLRLLELLLEARVSTHAPTRSATRRPAPAEPACRCFNPRAHAERDWPAGPKTPRRPSSFNPRAHAERDVQACFSAERAHHVSTHAPTRSATGAK